MTTRKDFLATSSLLAVAPALAQAATPSPAPSAAAKPSAHELTFAFDRARFDQILARPAKHKQCFGSTNIEGGDVLGAMDNSINAYVRYFSESPGTMQTVAVLYHGSAIAMAMSDSAWNELLIPSLKHFPSIAKDVPNAKRGKGNPYLHTTTNDPQDVSVESLVKKGASFLVCHNAIVGFSYGVAEALKESPAKAHAAILAAIVPGALVVPAGVMAINACQEAKFTYIQSTL
ncbi:MAG TPA: hypothetical protein VIG51_10210 [Candidatus Baltobacteraceae bacterium]|jgi:intracellular sulfur oxidation DsrE/DsrF family protein